MHRVATLSIMAVVTVSLMLVVPVNAIPSDTAIRAGCLSAKSALSQTEKNDAALRINRGRIYNEVSDLLYAMNARISNNRRSAPELSQITEEFNDNLSDFKETYSKYDDSLVALIKLECTKSPSGFYDSLVEVRHEREDLKSIVEKLDQQIDDYKSHFGTLKEKLYD